MIASDNRVAENPTGTASSWLAMDADSHFVPDARAMTSRHDEPQSRPGGVRQRGHAKGSVGSGRGFALRAGRGADHDELGAEPMGVMSEVTYDGRDAGGARAHLDAAARRRPAWSRRRDPSSPVRRFLLWPLSRRRRPKVECCLRTRIRTYGTGRQAGKGSVGSGRGRWPQSRHEATQRPKGVLTARVPRVAAETS